MVGQRAAWAALHHISHFCLTDTIGHTPRLTAGDEQIALGLPTFGDVNAKASIPRDIDVPAGKLVYLVTTHPRSPNELIEQPARTPLSDARPALKSRAAQSLASATSIDGRLAQ